ncbi:hypothetical protein ACP4OV_008052 [Aristida adscensionis]
MAKLATVVLAVAMAAAAISSAHGARPLERVDHVTIAVAEGPSSAVELEVFAGVPFGEAAADGPTATTAARSYLSASNDDSKMPVYGP